MPKPRESTRKSPLKSKPAPPGMSARELSPDHAEVELADVIDDAVPARGYQMLPMVGLGGSAGSIQALQTFFRAMPADSGLVFVVILHLSSDHESTLAELLQHATSMRVEQVNAYVKVEANCVYVIPPGKQLASADGHLELADLPNDRGRRVAVDLFFRTLADTHGPHAAAIVLSGADGDGAIGIKRIKERGGLTITQDPDEAEHQGMPRAAIGTGMVDWVLQVSEMPARLVKYYELGERLRLPPEEGLLPTEPPSVHRLPADDEAALRDVLIFLHTRTGRDFSYYKRATILRRLGRRLQVNSIDDLPSYLAFLRTNQGESSALLQDLLISVTNFFRDREAFDALELQIPALFHGKGPNDSIRVWTAGCATGEEAYSIAILLHEHARKLDAPPQIQVFATDLDEGVIKAAREGIYPDAITADVSEERLRRWFVRELHGYRVRREIRELVAFAPHDLLKDSPFSRLDLLSCRNLLIYLSREAQARAFDIFHFALRPGGRLFLGTSESIDNDSALFNAIDKKYRLYAQLPGKRTALPVPTGISALARSLDLLEKSNERPAIPRSNGNAALPIPDDSRATAGGDLGAGELHYQLIERFGPPSLVVNADYNIVHMSDSAGRLLQMTGGEPTRNLLQLVHPMLRIDLRAALFNAMQSKAPTEALQVPLVLNGERKTVDIRVKPADDLAPNYVLVQFEAHAASRAVEDQAPAAARPSTVTDHLERELDATRSQLRDTLEQSEASTEELKASNEELQAVNEELRSATEELETSREELQSINEELSTVNQELKSKVDELSHANADLHVLMASTAIATLFLDRDLRIMRFTPPAVDLFNLISTDIGRPLTDLTNRLNYPDMVRDARRALGELVASEREVQAGGRWFIARTLPYRSADDRIGGVVFTFVDITARRQTEEALREVQAEQTADLAALLRLQELSSRLLISAELPPTLQQLMEATMELQNADFGSVQLCDRASRTLEMIASRGFDPSFVERFRKVPLDLTAAASARALQRRARVLVADVDREQDYAPLREAAAQAGYRALQSTPLIDRNDQPLGVLTTYFRRPHRPSERELRVTDLYARQAADIIAFKLSEQELRRSEERLRLVVENAREYAIFSTDRERRVTSWNSGAQRLLGYDEGEIIGRLADVIFTPEDRAAGAPEQEAGIAFATGRAADERWHLRKDGSRFWGSGVMMAMRDADRDTIGLIKIFRDQTEAREATESLVQSRAELEQALHDNKVAREELESASRAKDRFLAVLSHELRTPLTPVVMAVQALARRPDLPEQARDALEMIRRNVKIESHLIDDLLDLTRISRGRLDIVAEPMDLQAAVTGAIEISEPDISGKNQTLEVALEASRHRTESDFNRLQQVVWNLLKNASKFTPKGGEIRVSTRSEGSRFYLAVSDNGVGIDPEALPTIFDAFSQGGEWVMREFGGLGLGLAISKATVEAHGGIITAESGGRGCGATFAVELPLIGPD